MTKPANITEALILWSVLDTSILRTSFRRFVLHSANASHARNGRAPRDTCSKRLASAFPTHHARDKNHKGRRANL
jgi:hypothetical protein